MCKTYSKKWDDPWFDEMDPLMKLMYYESFRQDLEEKHAFARNYAIFNGSFMNMEMAQRIVSEDNPDYASTDDDFDQSTRMVVEGRKKAEKTQKKKRRRRKVVNKS